ncbi:phytoene/squalene synthase family protein [Bdellovibrio sp. SKB1291214]|uniref:phytoene/squalene synthase family protein n=1 Tax=Bdellovibrio sp. SKB1291214 TaxID=1732569 RepID=UPI000B518B46|nr:phytoene/squalene synthase family protein [Bdellovibrio sp. SKB1291214]UYL07850.1 phytoene/squalene synthase family protein [Bdellovibrio sp. SKB1291214]
MSEIKRHHEAIRKGSKSFAAASLFFSKDQKQSAWRLYSWCRYCDDRIDEVPAQTAIARLQDLRVQLNEKRNSQVFAFQGLAQVIQNHEIPGAYPLYLLRGMEMDVQGRRYQTLSDLEEYCFCVAGVVGLMMCHVMGVYSDQALKHAVALGNAMQLTNICRDIAEDAHRGRVYLPLEWLLEYDVPVDDLLNPAHRESLKLVQDRLLNRAQELYSVGYEGLRYLSFRSAWAVLIAGFVYSQIGAKIKKSKSRGLDQRVYVTSFEKLILVTKATATLLLMRIRAKVSTDSLRIPQTTWRFE